jgi:hypothetical protein
MISFRPITSRVAKRIYGDSLAASAETTIEIAPPSRREVDLPIMLPDEPSRIISHVRGSNPQLNMERLTLRVTHQGPTLLYLIRDAIIADGTLLTPKCFQRLAPEKRKYFFRGSPEEIDEAALCSTYLTQKYFGHWLREGMSMELMAEDQGQEPLVLDHKPWTHEAAYRELLSLHPRRTRVAHCDRLWVFEFFQFNEGFTRTYNRLRERVRTRVGVSSEATKRVFLARGQSGFARTLANRDEVRSALVAKGFTIIDPELMEVADIARILGEARLVVAPEGSAMAHAAIAMPAGAGLLAIIGAQHFNLPYKTISDALGFRFGLTIADPAEGDRFTQPIDRLLRAIDLMEAALDCGSSASAPVA